MKILIVGHSQISLSCLKAVLEERFSNDELIEVVTSKEQLNDLIAYDSYYSIKAGNSDFMLNKALTEECSHHDMPLLVYSEKKIQEVFPIRSFEHLEICKFHDVDDILLREPKEFRPSWDKLNNTQKKNRKQTNRKSKKRR